MASDASAAVKPHEIPLSSTARLRRHSHVDFRVDERHVAIRIGSAWPGLAIRPLGLVAAAVVCPTNLAAHIRCVSDLGDQRAFGRATGRALAAAGPVQLGWCSGQSTKCVTRSKTSPRGCFCSPRAALVSAPNRFITRSFASGPTRSKRVKFAI
jgi:hypothetical protein